MKQIIIFTAFILCHFLFAYDITDANLTNLTIDNDDTISVEFYNALKEKNIMVVYDDLFDAQSDLEKKVKKEKIFQDTVLVEKLKNNCTVLLNNINSIFFYVDLKAKDGSGENRLSDYDIKNKCFYYEWIHTDLNESQWASPENPLILSGYYFGQIPFITKTINNKFLGTYHKFLIKIPLENEEEALKIQKILDSGKNTFEDYKLKLKFKLTVPVTVPYKIYLLHQQKYATGNSKALKAENLFFELYKSEYDKTPVFTYQFK